MDELAKLRKKKDKLSVDKQNISVILEDAIYILEEYETFPRIQGIINFLQKELEVLVDEN